MIVTVGRLEMVLETQAETEEPDVVSHQPVPHPGAVHGLPSKHALGSVGKAV